MESLERIINAFELHSVETIRQCFKEGVDPNGLSHGKPLIFELISMYTRGPRFSECIRAFIEAGGEFETKPLLTVLSNNPAMLESMIIEDPSIISSHHSLNCPFTPLFEASLLHVGAEYNHVDCAKILLAQGADPNAIAGIDEHGFGGHTAVFHTGTYCKGTYMGKELCVGDVYSFG